MSDQVADMITTWDTDNDKMSSDEEDAVLQLLSSSSPAASSAFIGRESSDKDESEDESTTSMQDETAGDIQGESKRPTRFKRLIKNQTYKDTKNLVFSESILNAIFFVSGYWSFR